MKNTKKIKVLAVAFLSILVLSGVLLSLAVAFAKMTIYKKSFFDEVGSYSSWAIGFGLGLGVAIVLIYLAMKKNAKFVKESSEQIHGDAKFLIDERTDVSFQSLKKFNEEYSDERLPAFVARVYRDKNNELAYNTILAENKKNTMHTLVLGATGSGKTQRFVYPTLNYNLSLSYQNKPNLFVTDVKGEIVAKFRDEFRKNNYEVVEINLNDPFKSNRWNPLNSVYRLWKKFLEAEKGSERYLKLKTEIDAEINNLIEPFFNAHKKNDNVEWILGAESIVKKTTAIINNAQYSFIMKLSPKDVDSINRLYESVGGLTENEKNFIATANRGYGLLISNTYQRQIVNVNVFDFERDIFNLHYEK
ncbi:type IV secretory system conjugative DNA transfer family protein [[Mycoplasma] imitans]|uniref:type IV secretory system conjugative DNA transfer family protein n=1 Tax=[Mycoplasma] imitans TaxID=29560 RepID=UPI0004863C1C|nr:type IV secretory system conjugative DNA transfer family protein [[Mycoplasma] imitans]